MPFLDRLRTLLETGARAECEGPQERRRDGRKRLLLKADVFPVAGFAEMRIVSVSRSGFSGLSLSTLEPEQPLVFSVRQGQFHEATVRWVRGRKFGADLEDALEILGRPGSCDAALLSPDPPLRRYPLDVSGRMALVGFSYRATVRDISQTGLRLECGAPLVEGQEVIVRLPDQRLVLASVRWRSDRMAGVETAERMEILRLVYADG